MLLRLFIFLQLFFFFFFFLFCIYTNNIWIAYGFISLIINWIGQLIYLILPFYEIIDCEYVVVVLIYLFILVSLVFIVFGH